MAATHDAVLLHGGRRIPTRTLISTIGNAPHPLLGLLPCAQQKGRLKTDTNLAVLGAPGVWAVGDCAWIVREGSEQPYGPTAQNAVRQARHCAENIVAVLRGRPPRPFHFDELGKLASIGRRSAVAEVFGIKFSGFGAWFVWRTVYLLKLPGWERRLRVAIDWTLDLLFRRDLTQLKLFRSEKVDQAHYEPGEVIVKQGEIGDSFYIIVKGEVDVVREEPGAGETRLATLGAGEHFGEVALLQKIPRTATVRAVMATDLLSIGRGDFEAVARSLNLVKAGLADVVKKRSPALVSDVPKQETSPPN
jgi:NADH dehydrogenase